MARPRWTVEERTSSGSALALARLTDDPPVLHDLHEQAVRIEPEVGEGDAVPHPRTDPQQLHLGGPLADEGERLRTVRPQAHQGVPLHPGRDLPRSSGRPLGGEARMKANQGGILGEDILEGGELGGELAPGLASKLPQRVLEAPLEEPRGLGSEPKMLARVGDRSEARARVVAFLQLG